MSFNKTFDLMSPTKSTATPSEVGSKTVDYTPRTHCRPSFKEGDRPHDFTQTMLPTCVLDVAAFDADKELLVSFRCVCVFV